MTRVLDVGNEQNYAGGKSRQKTWPVYRRLLGYAFQYKGRLAASVFFAIVVAVSFSSIIVSVGTTIELLYGDDAKVTERVDSLAEDIRGFPLAPAGADERFTNFVGNMRDNTASAVGVLSVVLIALSIISGCARFLQEYLAGAIGASISVQLNREMFENILDLPHRFYENTTSGEVVARFTNDAFMVNKGIANVFVKLLREPIKAVFLLGLALTMNVFLTLVVLLIVPPVLLVISAVGKKVKKSVRRSLQKVASMAAIINETVAGITVIKGFRMEDYEKSRMRGELSHLRKHLTRMVRADAAIGPMTEFLIVVGIVAFIILSQQQVASGAVEPSQLVILFGSLAAMLDPLRKLATVNNMVQTSVASAERVFEFIDQKPDIVERPSAIDVPPLREAVHFEDIHFSYDGKSEVLRGIDFELKRGEMVALVGFSGAGKSTIAKLIPRFYDPTGGRITLDGQDIRDITLASLRDQISIVTQETILFHESIRGNIAFGQTDFTDERIQEAAKAAHAHEFIDRMPNGYDTFLGEGGVNLSGGQRQRLSIARAIIKDPAILILDEATSSLDSESENAIQEAIAKFVVGRTTLVIAHRLSTIRQADRILVIDEGRVVEEGSHQELLTKGGIYQRLYEVQFAATAGMSGASAS